MSKEREYKNKLQVNHTYLVDNLEVSPVIDLLFERQILRHTDLERIEAERSRPDKAKLLLAILRGKANAKCYEVFLECLDHEKVGQGFIRETLEKTPLGGQYKEELGAIRLMENILRECLVVKNKSELPVDDLQRVLNFHLHRHKVCLELSLPEVYDLVTKIFPDVQKKKNKNRNVVALINCALQQQDPHAPNFQEIDGEAEFLKPVPLDEVKPHRVASVMREVLERNKMDPSLADCFEQQDIDGEVLSELDDSLVEKLFPDLTMGKRHKLLKARNEAVKELQKPAQLHGTREKKPAGFQKLETFRAFDTRPGVLDVYEKEHVLPEEQSRPGFLLHVLHKYCLVTAKGETVEVQIARLAVQFAAACMNERANGTIHFGVAGRNEDGRKLSPGEVEGLRVNKQKCELALTEEIYQAFFPDQRQVAVKVIRDPVFVPVLTKTSSATGGCSSAKAGSEVLYVVEVDVVPHSSLVTDEAFFLLPITGKHTSLYRFLNGEVQAVEGQDLYEFMNLRKRLTTQRDDSERQSRPHICLSPDLNRKLHGLLTGGNLFEETDIYPLLFLSPCAASVTNDYLAENFNCLKSLAPLAVFDFDFSSQDADNQSRGLYFVMESRLGQVYKTLTTDNFDRNSEENRNNKDSVSKLLESIDTGSFKSWIFCNGYAPLGKDRLETTTWRACRAEGCKEAIRFYKERIPQGKACIVIMLLSRNYDVLLGALEDVFSKFPDQWIILAETSKVAQDLMAEVVRRSYVEKRVLEERSVIGMPWSHVNQSIMNICGKTTSHGAGCILPSTTGTPCLMKEREKNQLSDLEILSSKQCEEDDLIKSGSVEQLEKKKRKMEINFYRGQMVSWWNFYFGDHVLRRAPFAELLKQVRIRLDGKIPEDEKVAVVTLLHQRGAGGSTTAREILWELKEEFRCCVVKQISDQTCDQIAHFRNFAEQSCPRPPLVLIDNEDEEKVFQLCSLLNEKARREARDKGLQVFCVLIICVRMTEFPKKKDESRVTLGHALPTREVTWFRTKYQALEERYKKQQLSVHPKLLISFNMLKENFSKEYKKQIVEEFVDKVTDFREKQLLKYIALINSFDPDFQSIPMSCFNPIMCPLQTMPKQLPRLGQKTFMRDVHWETRLSESLNNLLNRTSDLALGGDVKAVRIISNNLSREILQYICLQEKKKTSDVMHEFLHTDIFKSSNESSVQSKLVKIMKEILKKRAASKRGRAKFSPIILEIGNVEGFEEAAKVLKVGFEKFDDPMIAQQIARIYIHIQNFKEAEKYAQMALNMKPKSSYLCDTHGQVYKEKLISALKDHLASEELLEGEKAREVIDVATEAIKIFRREQKLSDDETTGYNNCGFFSELRVVVTTLDLCRFLKIFKFDQGEKLHTFLIKKSEVPQQLLEELGDERIAFLKNLSLDYEKPMRRLEDEQIQLKEDSCYQYSPCYTDSVQERLTFVHLQECLDTYFGEDTDEVPPNLIEADKCEFRRRRVRRKGGNSLRSIYGLKDDENAATEFAAMHRLIEKNVQTRYCNAFDLKTMLSLTLARISKDKKYARTLSMERVLEQTLELYETTKSDVTPYLEAYLYLVMFHWPTEWRLSQRLSLCACSKLGDVIKEWKTAFQKNHPTQKEEEGRKPADRRKGTTLFFLGQGEGFDEIVFYSELQTLDGGHKMGDSIWNTTEAQRRLMKLRGTLLHGGGEMAVTIKSQKGSSTVLNIPTSFPIKDPSLWQKTVRFVLGFCWSGPKAFSVKRDDDEVPDLQAASTPCGLGLHEPRKVFDRRQQKLMSKEAVNEFWQLYYRNRTERGRVERDISLNEKNPTKTVLLKKEKEDLENKRLELVEKRTSVLQGPDL